MYKWECMLNVAICTSILGKIESVTASLSEVACKVPLMTGQIYVLFEIDRFYSGSVH